jgi:hypothetical protein
MAKQGGVKHKDSNDRREMVMQYLRKNPGFCP